MKRKKSLSINLVLLCLVDIEEGVGNSHPSHALPNSTGGGHGDEAEPQLEGEKSVLQVGINIRQTKTLYQDFLFHFKNFYKEIVNRQY